VGMTLFPQSPKILHWILNPTSPQPPSVKVKNLSCDNDLSVAVLEGTTPEVVVQEGTETFVEDPSLGRPVRS
jgi:hypothetical protein